MSSFTIELRRSFIILLVLAIGSIGRSEELTDGELGEICQKLRSMRVAVKSAKLTIERDTKSDVPEEKLFEVSQIIELVRSVDEFTFKDDRRHLKTKRLSKPFELAKALPRPDAGRNPGIPDVPQNSGITEIRIFDGVLHTHTYEPGIVTEFIPSELLTLRPSNHFDMLYLGAVSWFLPRPEWFKERGVHQAH